MKTGHLNCYTTANEPEAADLTQVRARLKRAIEQIGGESTKSLLHDLWALEEGAKDRSFVLGLEAANSETLPYLPARRLVEMIEQEIITEAEALAALDEKRARRRREREEMREKRAA